MKYGKIIYTRKENIFTTHSVIGVLNLMNKLKTILIVLFSVCAIAATVCFCAACGNNSDVSYPDYRPVSDENGGGGNEEDPTNARYEISVKSIGGLSMSGVRISLLNASNETVAIGVSINGTVVISTSPAVYTVVIDPASLPEGYYAPEDTILTEAASGTISVVLDTRIINTTASEEYAIGDIMHDFSFADAETGEELVLSSLLSDDSSYKAVVLNFFYISCGPCRAELPAMQQAYTQYSSDVKIIALSNTDSVNAIRRFKTGEDGILSTDISFNMAHDGMGLTGLFSVTSFPTTVVIDRYGMVAFIDSGSMPQASQWSSMFAYYTSSTYTQDGSNGGGDEDPDDPDDDIKVDIPNVEMPASSVIEAAVAGEGFTFEFFPELDPEDAVYSWPFLAGEENGRGYMYPANSVRKDDGTKINNSYSIIYSNITMKAGDMLSFDYNVNTEDGYDYLYVFIDRDLIARYTGDSNGWTNSGNVFFATKTGTFELAFAYLKDEADSDDTVDDIVRVRELTIINAENVEEPTDAITAAVSGDSIQGASYINVIAPAPDDDHGYYYVEVDGRRQVLVADFLHYTTWADFRDLPRISNAMGISESAIYSFIIANYSSSDNSVYTLDGINYTSTVVDTYYMQLFSETGYVPVNNALKKMLDSFAKQYSADSEIHGEYYENQWLEFCYYFMHYGAAHEEGAVCWETYDPVAATHWYNAPTIDVSGLYNADGSIKVSADDNVDSTITGTATVLSGVQSNAGARALFTPKTSGVYLIKTLMDNTNVGQGPSVGIFDHKEEVNYFTTYHPYNYDYFGLGSVDVDGDGIYDVDSRFDGQVWVYYYFEANTTYCLRFGYFSAGTVGEYDYGIQYLGETYSVLFNASILGDGTWTDVNTYTAIPVILNAIDNKYYHDNGGEYGSVVYFDFIHGTYMDNTNKSLEHMIKNGLFNLTDIGGEDYTDDIMYYYNLSIQGKNKGDLEYGLVEATADLVTLMNLMLEQRLGSENGASTGFWLSACAYYQEFGPDQVYPWDVLRNG